MLAAADEQMLTRGWLSVNRLTTVKRPKSRPGDTCMAGSVRAPELSHEGQVQRKGGFTAKEMSRAIAGSFVLETESRLAFIRFVELPLKNAVS